MRFPEVVEARRMFGTLDYVLRVATKELSSYETFAIERLQAIPSIARVESHLTLKQIKSS